MNYADTVYLVSRLVVTGLAAFLAIFLWSKTRDLAWMLIVIGVVASYSELIFDLLVRFGLVVEAELSPFGLPVARIVVSNLPYAFFIAAFVSMIARKRSH